MAESRPVELPSPSVRFPDGFAARLGTFAARLSAAREREEVGRRRTLEGEGQEFFGHRPYREGEDLRGIDWALFARLDRPFVRVTRSEAREDWWIGIDTSASMGVGADGKLQSAAETVAATAATGLQLGAHVTLSWCAPDGARKQLAVRRPSDMRAALSALEGLVASGARGLEALVTGAAAGEPRRAGRILLVGDFLDVDVRAILALLGGRRRVHLGQVLAAEEWDPSVALDSARGAAWIDPESGRTSVGTDGLATYAARLESFVERWSDLARTHRMVHRAWSAGEPFEAHLEDLLR